MTKKRFVCYFDNIVKKWCVQNTDSLDMHYVADEPMGKEFAHLLNLYHQTLDNMEKENEQLKEENTELKNDNKRMVKFIMSKGFSLKDYVEWLNEEVWK